MSYDEAYSEFRTMGGVWPPHGAGPDCPTVAEMQARASAPAPVPVPALEKQPEPDDAPAPKRARRSRRSE